MRRGRLEQEIKTTLAGSAVEGLVRRATGVMRGESPSAFGSTAGTVNARLRAEDEGRADALELRGHASSPQAHHPHPFIRLARPDRAPALEAV